jgi:hypothetical protein
MASANFSKALRDCASHHYLDAAKETFTTSLASMLPLVLGFGISYVLKDGKPISVLSTFLETNGALFVAASLAGPLFYIISKKYGKLPGTLTYRFPAGQFFLLAAATICIVASIMFTLSVAYSGSGDGIGNEYAKHVRVDIIRWVSLAILSTSIVFLFFVSAVRNMLEDGHAASDAMRQDTDDFFDKWRRT